MLPVLALALALIGPQDPAFDPGPNPMLMRHPTLSQDAIVFQFASDLWKVSREGGEAERLTAGPGVKTNPFFSPDGKWIAFSAVYDGNEDVFVMPAEGGAPKRLTAHPAPDLVSGWSPDGKSVVFSSTMLSATGEPSLFTVPFEGGVPKMLPFPFGTQAAFSPDGTHLAYVPHGKWEQAWKRYRGGQTTPIWIGAMSDSKVKPIPRNNTNDEYPMWVGRSIYFTSDEHGPVGLDRYDLDSGRVTEAIPGKGFDIKSACAGPGAIVYERLGSINLYDLQSHRTHQVPISIHGDFLEVRPEFKSIAERVEGTAISPTGKRIAVSARGWIATVPVEKGDIRVLDGAQGVHRRDPDWSPDGRSLAYLSDEGGIQHLEVYDLASGATRKIGLGNAPCWYEKPLWSPDSKKIAYTDNLLRLWVLDAGSGKSTLVDTGLSRGRAELVPQWSPDSEWLTWSRDLKTLYNSVYVYSLKSGQKAQVTDGIVDATSPTFDRGGKYLYFLGSTTIGVGADFDDIESLNSRNETSRVYAVVLRKELPSPSAPESDEETGGATKPQAEKATAFRIDLDHIERRIVPLPMPEAVYSRIEAGPDETIFALSTPPRALATSFGGPGTLEQFRISTMKATSFAQGVSGFMVSADGSKLLIEARRGVQVVSSAAPPAPGAGSISTDSIETKIDPRAEWNAIYHEVWRDERLLFYDPGLHGIDSVAMEHRYEPFLANIYSRDDLNYLFTDMLGELSIGHMFIGGGDSPRVNRVPGGLLGIDFSFENGHYRLTRVYDGERWNPDLYAPMSQPGVNAQAGEYLLAIDGEPLTQVNDIYLMLENKAGKQVKVTLGPNADGSGSRDVIVKPVANEQGLRMRAWTEDNRRLVTKMTGGLAGYLHVPDTGNGGWTEFNRFYYSQSDKQGVIVDERFNHGGFINDFMIREMEKPLDFGTIYRSGGNVALPLSAIYGPKVMLMNEMAGSGGDIFPFMFRAHHIGKLIGKRTWGGALSAYGFNVIDGGNIRAPDDAMYDPITSKWVIEGEGVKPDIDVDLDPYLWRQGRDAQLEAAIDEIKKEMAKSKPVKLTPPPYPDKTKLPRGQ